MSETVDVESTDVETTDVVVVGGGIAGSALASAFAAQGLGVTVLERQVAYRDKVRGEYLQPWGAIEAGLLGVQDVLLEAGGTWITEIVGYDELVPAAAAERHPLVFSSLRPEVPGAMDLGHPRSCQALADHAVAQGARAVRGVGDVLVQAGATPTVRYELDDVEHEVRCRLVVGADGRASSVRRQLGLTLEQTVPRTWGTGMLVEDLDEWPGHRATGGTEGDRHFFVFPRSGGLARLYQMVAVEQKDRFTGPDRQQTFLESFRLDCLPLADAVTGATPAGPCAGYPMHDTWTDTVAVPGVVLIGDAAGYNDPIIGEGLSIVLRDARMVAEVVGGGSDWSPAAFAGYAAERRERMRRLRICAFVDTELRCTFTPEGRARRGAIWQRMRSDPLLAALMMSPLAGTDDAPPEAFADANLDRVLAYPEARS